MSTENLLGEDPSVREGGGIEVKDESMQCNLKTNPVKKLRMKILDGSKNPTHSENSPPTENRDVDRVLVAVKEKQRNKFQRTLTERNLHLVNERLNFKEMAEFISTIFLFSLYSMASADIRCIVLVIVFIVDYLA